jgi:hypothetical protein
VGDLLGPGWSAEALTRRGLRVLAAESCKWTGRVIGDQKLAAAAARRMGREGGFAVHIGNFQSILPKVSTANYDSCGPYLAPTSRDVQAMYDHDLRAFVVTCLLSRVEGMRGKDDAHYLRMAEVGLSVDAPGYWVEQTIRYRGDRNLPMAAFFVVRKGASEYTLEPGPETSCDICGHPVRYHFDHPRGPYQGGSFYHVQEGFPRGLMGCAANARAQGLTTTGLKRHHQASNHQQANRRAMAAFRRISEQRGWRLEEAA